MTRYTGFSHLLASQAAARPHAPAILYEKAGAKSLMTRRELLFAAQKRAAELCGKRAIFVLCDGSLENVVTVFGAVLAGVRVILADAGAQEDALCALLEYTRADCLYCEDEELAEILTAHLDPGAPGGAGELLFFTSGTTDRNKAVVLTDASLCASAWNGSALLPLQPEDTLMCMLPLCHVFGFVCSLLWPLVCGAAVALGRGPRHYGDDCAFFEPTALSAVPLLAGFLIKHRCLNPALRLVLIGAGDCPPQLISALEAQGIFVSFGYGLTETSSGVALSLGEDKYAMTVCPEADITLAQDGEILIKAPTCMMQGYWQRPEDTAAAVTEGTLHTGDLGRWDEKGLLHITGRKKEMLVLSDGTKLFLPEYEPPIRAALGTEEAAVIVRDGAPVLVIKDCGRTKAEILAALGPLMARESRARQIKDVITVAENLPRTATGKIQRWAIQQKVSAL